MENTIYIKKWFMGNIKQENRNYNFYSRKAEVIHETEKAYKVLIECSSIDGEWDGEKTVWVPKSCTMTGEEYQSEQADERKHFEDGCRAYDQLIEFAKANGVKGIRSGMRKATIEQKIKESGIEYA